MLEGSVTIGRLPLQESDNLFTTPGEEHNVVAGTEATIFVSAEKAASVVE